MITVFRDFSGPFRLCIACKLVDPFMLCEGQDGIQLIGGIVVEFLVGKHKKGYYERFEQFDIM